MMLPLHIFEERYRIMVARRITEDPMFGVVLTRSGREVGDQPEIYGTGTAASLITAVQYGDGRYDIAVRGGERFQVTGGNWDEGYLTSSVKWLSDEEPADAVSSESTRLAESVRSAFNAYLEALESTAAITIARVQSERGPRATGFAICAAMPFGVQQRQRQLEAPTTLHLLEDLQSTLRRERELLEATGIGGATLEHPGARFSSN
jgi:hypothetical protein